MSTSVRALPTRAPVLVRFLDRGVPRGMAAGLAAGLALVLTLTLTACGSGAPASAPKPTASASPTAPPGLDTTPPEKPADPEDTARGAVAYATYFAQLVQHAIRTRTARPVAGEAFDQATCSGCRELSTFVEELVSGGYWEIGADLQLGPLKAARQGDRWRVTGRFVYPIADYVSVDGSKQSQVSAKNYAYSLDLTWEPSQGRWRVRDYQFRRGTATG